MLDDPALRRAASTASPMRAWCCSARRATALGVLPGARRDHPAADRAARLHHRRGRGRLARRRGASTATSATRRPRPRRPSRRSSASRPGCGATPRSRASSNGCASTTTALARPSARAGFYGLDLYNLRGSIAAVLDYLDEVDPEAARGRRASATAASRPGRTTRRPTAAPRSAAATRECEAAVIAHAATCSDAGSTTRRTATASSTRRRTRAWSRRPSATTAIMYYGGAESLEPARQPHVRDARAPARAPRAARPRPWSGRTTPTSATRARPRWAGPRRASTSASSCRERFGERGRADRLRHRPRHRGRGERLGRRRWRSSGCGRRTRDSYERAVPRHRRRALPARPAARPARGAAPAAARAAARALHRRDLPARDRALRATMSRRACREQFDAWVWFDETHAVTPLGRRAARTGVPETYPFGL